MTVKQRNCTRPPLPTLTIPNLLGSRKERQKRSQSRLKNWKRFDTYVKSRNSVWMVNLNTTEWKKSSCTCTCFFKSYICKHICGIAIIQNLLAVPPEAKNIPLGEKRKRGRPPKAKKALIVQ